MSCVLAEIERGEILMCADSAATNGDEIYTVTSPKVFAHGPFLFGFCGSYRVGQILRYRVELPEPPPEGDLEAFLVRHLVPALRCAVERDGAAASGPRFLGERTTILLGCRVQLYCIGADLTVTPCNDFAAIGSGRLRAYAALHALRAAGIGPARRRLELAMAATAEFTSNVRRPWCFLSSARPVPA